MIYYFLTIPYRIIDTIIVFILDMILWPVYVVMSYFACKSCNFAKVISRFEEIWR